MAKKRETEDWRSEYYKLYEKSSKSLDEFQGRIEVLEEKNEKQACEIGKLKMTNGGLKTSNENYKKKVENLKALNRECDELNEKRIAELEEKGRIIDGLQAQVSAIVDENKKLTARLKDAEDECESYVLKYRNMLALPWYRKMFFKG